MNPLYLNHLTFCQPENLTPQIELVKDLTKNLQEDHPIKKRLSNMSNYGFQTIATSKNQDESQMVSQNLSQLFQKIDKNEISHIVHSSPTAVIGQNGGIIGGIGRQLIEDHNLENVSFIPVLSGCASIQPVFDVSKSLAMAHQKPVIMIFSLHSSTCRNLVKEGSQKQQGIIEDVYQASPFVLFGDSCISCVISPFKMGNKSYEIVDSQFKYNAQKWVAKAYFEEGITMKLNGENQKNMLKEFLMKKLPESNKQYGVNKYFVHNQIPLVFNEIINSLGIKSEQAPEIVSKYGNLACQTSMVNMAENEDQIQIGDILGLFSVGEHTGISESTIILKAVNNVDNQES